ncbi:RNA polymerase sigma factor [Spirilliplanes yamanashiensis]|uniref:RNA polymerase sigma factor n=1 Tax=Spirilliplanes yamanashiensis TaxID=42233 RepID=A0A8J3YBI9_9ACTN|nr:sigma-70 family RNA polymerase sigma factor [Spirilliplanes yamanashiensis]MDP9819084.1 RNA polymerase sigma-70 factor (ECF subfamily) [Spirilliplanes yamanashiensis]GIJ05538.1 RNA polymerase sigma factor [Spirilliplanes yamanashiensis]
MPEQPAPPDAAESRLVDRARRGEAAAFERLVGDHAQRTWAVCYRITGNAHDAEDALQDALIAAWQNLPRFRGDSRFGTWLHRIAANASLAVVRRRRDVVMDELPTARAEAAMTDHYERLAESDRIEAALRTLPEDFRVALVLREFGDLSYQEIATHQGVGVQTVKSRLNRARSAMAVALGRA